MTAGSNDPVAPPLEDVTPEDETDEALLAEHRAIPENVRAAVFERDGYECRIDGCLGTQQGGSARLLAQRLRGETATPENVITHCHRCARWMRQLPSREILRPALRDRLNGVEIRSTWVEILDYLDEEGPASPGDIRPHVSLDSAGGVRKALYRLMRLDVEHDDVTTQLVVKDQLDDLYGLPRQIPEDRRSRGDIPIDPIDRQARLLDELVRQLDTALDAQVTTIQRRLEASPDCDTETVIPLLEEAVETHRDDIIADRVGRNPEQLRELRIRADAFQFPFGTWADPNRPRDRTRAAIAAVDALGSITENLSRSLLGSLLSEAFTAHEEPHLAAVIDDWLEPPDETATQVSVPGTTSPDKEATTDTTATDESTPCNNSTAPDEAGRSSPEADAGGTGGGDKTSSNGRSAQSDDLRGPRVDSFTIGEDPTNTGGPIDRNASDGDAQ